ncbi:MAG: formylmethanofuran--tetrahydromethanopterin N-formyltransferase [Candidatus Methanoliparum thermophilum]|uniref:Formylmethanofuran--tetrahydromethanopterin formyltransferase n=1 Tax=Methanoliparum thermophilum TaxID=2491083 RepID=A0A520KS56_METT2|nr:formylmethanofuran--tetrahydromethanopterin N-formyltransferase [Candidatus Methanoliparum sp. LAM-1]RZN64609.1 MAG: formylmethanofuran--tetrahydromethanopterin N-formyltransferase [Candidatus Methanoliparum thermophilum]BDC35768.1 formylmethanofuran--tetrahydromethanopterin formyltransferase [Candidatus Methanoliparum sp. LAM-1]
MRLNNVEIEETFAEVFSMKCARVLITALNERWAKVAATEATGFGTSIIGCPSEAGIEKYLTPEETPDGRFGAYIQIYHGKTEKLEDQILERIGQCVLTSPTTAVFNGLPNAEKQSNIGFKLKFFGDGFDEKREINGRTVYSIPIMEGDFIIEEKIGIVDGIAGGNFFIMAENQMSALNAAEVAVDAIFNIEGCITPFPGGIVASGSKVGSNKYKFLKASTNEKFCPTLKDKIKDSQIPEGVNGIYEVIANGMSLDLVKEAMRKGITAATKVPGVVKITSGNYGGKLGKYTIDLKDLF